MTDEEVARELDMTNMLVDPIGGPGEDVTANYKRRWLAVARRARQLLGGGPTPEEKAVIEAAEAFADRYQSGPHNALSIDTAVRALRASRQPKPRYTVVSVINKPWPWPQWDVGIPDEDNKLVARCNDEADAERIAKLLNEADR